MLVCNIKFIGRIETRILTEVYKYGVRKTFWRIVKRRSTEEFDGLPYVCTLLQACMWIYYGLTKPGGILIATVNIVGTVLEVIYVTLFLIYASPSKRANIAMWVGFLDVGFLGAAVLVTQFAVHGDLRIDVIGFICAALCIVMYGSPLAIMGTVIRTKSVEYMPFLLSFILFINAAIWTFYSVITKDVFLAVPNGVGFLLGVAQLILYVIYMNPKRERGGTEGIEEGKQPLLIQ